MKLAARLTVPAYLTIASIACALLAACPGQFNPSPPDVTVMPTAAQVLDAAQSYYVAGSERRPRDTTDSNFPAGHSVPDSEAPNLTIATMTPNPGPIPFPGRILARITSSRDYLPMGIHRGRNILWRDLLGRAWIDSQTGGAHELIQVPGYVFDRPPVHEPSLIRVRTNSFAFVACLDDCPSGHCGMF